MDKTNSQPKSSRASVGSDQPIEVPGNKDSSQSREEPRSAGEPSGHENIPRHRNHRYFDESDDMIERIRRMREAFEKKINSFQGVNWPYYEKRTIVGKKPKAGAQGSQNSSTVDPKPGECVDLSSVPAKPKEKP